jgi:hypothetical protein
MSSISATAKNVAKSDAKNVAQSEHSIKFHTGTPKGHSGNVQGTFRERSGNVQGNKLR